MTYTIAVCTVNNSWWWTEELSEICRVSFQNKFEKLVHLFGFLIRKFVTMHGHMNVKFFQVLLWEWEGQSTTVLVKNPFNGRTTCFGPTAGPSSGHKEYFLTYSWMLPWLALMIFKCDVPVMLGNNCYENGRVTLKGLPGVLTYDKPVTVSVRHNSIFWFKSSRRMFRIPASHFIIYVVSHVFTIMTRASKTPKRVAICFILKRMLAMISGFRSSVNEIFALLQCYTA
jgi:hypothetical protein